MVKICKLQIIYLIATAAIPYSRSQPASLILHHTSFDGGLYWFCPIARLDLGGQLHLNISLRHETKLDSFKNSVCSQWKISGLETSITCEDIKNIIWRSPAGVWVRFKTNPPHNQRHLVSEGHQLYIETEDVYVVTDRKSRKWSYNRGELTKVRLENGVELSFESENGLIKKIMRENRVILQAIQTDDTLLFLSDGHEVAAIKYDTSGRMIESITFGNIGRPSLRFAYEDRNLAAIWSEDKLNYKFTWKMTGLYNTWFTVLRYPFYLKSDGHFEYYHKLAFGIAQIISVNATGHWEEKQLILKNGSIIQRTK